MKIGTSDRVPRFVRRMPGLLAALVGLVVVVIAHADVPYPSFKAGDVVSASQMNANFRYLAAAMPPGVVQAYAGAVVPAPPGWFYCDGSAVSRTTYKDLFAAVGVSFGAGDGMTTFNLPDLRGVFLRGVDNGVNRDPDAKSRTALMPGGATGDAVGSYQLDQLAAHSHQYTSPAHTDDKALGGQFDLSGTATTATSTVGGNETRPKNVSVSYIIWSGVVP